jgi:hypothetical protein
MTDVLGHADVAAARRPAAEVTRLAEDPTEPGAAGPVAPPVWREVILVLGFYGLYTLVRGQFGSAALSTDQALANAQAVMSVEQHLGIANELALQQWFLQWTWMIRAFNIFYGTFHFVVPIAVLVVLHRRDPGRYRRWRDSLAATTALALVGFSLFPLMPPRLLCECALGSGTASGFVDTLAEYGGLWSFGSHGVGAVSNQYAAMPSLHFAWALWCACALYPLARRRWARGVVVAFPVATLVVIVVTANHFWLDAVGGALVLGVGHLVSRAIELAVAGRRRRAAAGPGPDAVPVILVDVAPPPAPLPSIALSDGRSTF